jgi:DNA-binding NarL/FixJ family response regulator
MDINLPGASGVEATRRAAQIAPATAVLIVTMVDDDTVFAALAAGARGYVLKSASAGEIAAALRTVARAAPPSARESPPGSWPGLPGGCPAGSSRPGQTT